MHALPGPSVAHDVARLHYAVRDGGVRPPVGAVPTGGRPRLNAHRLCAYCLFTRSKFSAALRTSGGKSVISNTCLTSMTSLSSAGQRDAHSRASCLNLT